MIESGVRVRLSPRHWLAPGALATVDRVESEHPTGEPRVNAYCVALDRPTAHGVREIWVSPADLERVG